MASKRKITPEKLEAFIQACDVFLDDYDDTTDRDLARQTMKKEGKTK